MPMEAMVLIFVAALTPLAGLILAIVAVVRIGNLSKRIRSLEARLAPQARAPVTPAPTAATAPAAPPRTPAPAPLSSPTPPPRTASPSTLEERVGGIWLQNVGSVLLLVGSLFLILWGYTQGRIGPEVLVAAGVALGAVTAWRGDVIARTIRPLGHALLGVGLGVVYITLYLGHFEMNVLGETMTLVLLALVSFVTVDIGLRRAQPVIAGLGILGAFMPLVLSPLSGLGFRLPFPMTLGYLGLTNAVLIVLTAIHGWSGLSLLALLFTSLAWINNAGGRDWDLGAEIGLAALFTGIGMAPVVRLIRSPDPIRRMDLAVVALAPMLLLVTSFPFFAAARSGLAGGLLLGLGAANLATALWVDTRRSRRDLWRPLTAAGVVFVTAALERLIAKENLALAWCAEGAVLVWLGMADRGGWFRFLGYGVSALAALRVLFFSGSYDPVVAGGGIGVVNANAIRDLACIVAVALTADRMGRRRSFLSVGERHAPGVWFVGANVLLLSWLGREAEYIGRLLAPLPWVAAGAPGSVARAAFADSQLSLPTVAAAWAFQAAALGVLSRVRHSALHRHVAYGVALLAWLVFLMVIVEGRHWILAGQPTTYPTAWIALAAVAFFFVTARLAWDQRTAAGFKVRGGVLPQAGDAFREIERRAPEVGIVLASAALMLWTARGAGQVAMRLTPGAAVGAMGGHDATTILASVLTSGAWVLQAGVLFAVGWIRRSAFHRWLALACVAVTLFKFAFFDLQRVDVFWRFVIALGIGAALLLVSFVYQRAERGRRTERASPGGASG